MTLTAPERETPPPPEPAPRYRSFLGGRRATWIMYATFVVTVVLVLMPIVPTIYQSVIDRPLYADGAAGTLQNYVRLFTEADFGTIILNTVLLAALTTVISVVLGVVLAVLLVRCRLPGRRVMSAFVLWPIYLSPLVLGFAWITVYGPSGYLTLAARDVIGTEPWYLYTIPGMALTMAVAYLPMAYLFCAGALELADPALENAARVAGAGPLRILRSVILPMLRPAVFYSVLLIFSGALEELSIPLLYGGPEGLEFFSTFLYNNGLTTTDPDYGLLGAASVFILTVMIVLVVVQAFALRNAQRFVAVRGKASRPSPLRLGRWRWVAFALVVVYLLLGPLLPIAGLVLRAFTYILSPLTPPILTFYNFELVLSYDDYVRAIENTVIIALVGGVVITLLAAVIVLVARRSTFRFARPLEFTALLPQAMPGLIIGIGFFWAFALIPGLGFLSGSLAALIVAFGMRGLPAAFGAIAPMVMQVGHELDDGARTVGADWWRTFSRVLVRLLAPALLASFVILFIQMAKEFTPALFLGSANNQVIGTTLLQLWVSGQTGPVAALSCIQIALVTIVVLIAQRVLKVRTHA